MLILQQCDVPLMEYDVTDKDLKIRIGQYVKVSLESFQTGAVGGGLLYFGVDSDIGKKKSIVKNNKQETSSIIQPQYV